MIKRIAERFVANERRWLIVIVVTFVLALATWLPQVDLLLADRSERSAMEAQLAESQKTVSQLPLYEERRVEETEKLAAFRERQVDETTLADLRSWIVTTARQAGCQVRRIDIANPISRDWLADDGPLETPTKQQLKDKRSKTPFQLQTRSVALSITGTTVEVMSLLKALDTEDWLMHKQSVEIRPTAGESRVIQLDVNLRYFALVRKPRVA